jgi:hypothetical protein
MVEIHAFSAASATYNLLMQTTVDIDPDVLDAARKIAERRNTTLGAVISELLRHSLRAEPESGIRNGIRLFPEAFDAQTVTPQIVKNLLEETE